MAAAGHDNQSTIEVERFLVERAGRSKDREGEADSKMQQAEVPRSEGMAENRR